MLRMYVKVHHETELKRTTIEPIQDDKANCGLLALNLLIHIYFLLFHSQFFSTIFFSATSEKHDIEALQKLKQEWPIINRFRKQFIETT